jgi:hypothetical protein
MSKFFVKVTRTYATKNKLEKAIYEALKKHDCTLLDKKHLETFKRELMDEIATHNLANPRCMGKELKFFNPNNYDEAEQLYVEDVIYLSVYPVKIEA